MKMFFASAVLVLVGVAAMGCTVGRSGVGPGGGGTNVTDGGTTPTNSGLSCVQVLDCVGACPESDSSCKDACLAKGTPEAQTRTEAVVECVQAAGCTDQACAETSCQPALTACATATAPGPSPGPNGPPGAVPADLVGVWSRTNRGDTDRLTFNADGTGSRYVGVVTGGAGCASFTAVTETGTVVVTDDRITINAADVVSQDKSCGAAQNTVKGNPSVVELVWSRQDASTIVVYEASCLETHPTDQGYCKLALTKQ